MTSPRAVAALVAALALALGGCSGDSGSSTAASSSAPSSTGAPPTTTSAVPTGPFGAGCSGVPPSGAGSFADMAALPVGVAATHNPRLSALVSAIGAAKLGDSLNSQQNVTVLAPINAAFEAIPAPDRQALLADSARLTALLTHHVIQGRLTPDRLAGTHTTLNNDEVTIEGSGSAFTVPAAATVTKQKPATVVCGNVQTANATVYLIDQVLAPPAR